MAGGVRQVVTSTVTDSSGMKPVEPLTEPLPMLLDAVLDKSSRMKGRRLPSDRGGDRSR